MSSVVRISKPRVGLGAPDRLQPRNLATAVMVHVIRSSRLRKNLFMNDPTITCHSLVSILENDGPVFTVFPSCPSLTVCNIE